MKKLRHTVQAKEGIHVISAGLLVDALKDYKSFMTLSCDGQTVSCKKIVDLMSLGVRQGETVSIMAEGSDEAEAIAAAEEILRIHM